VRGWLDITRERVRADAIRPYQIASCSNTTISRRDVEIWCVVLRRTSGACCEIRADSAMAIIPDGPGELL